MCDSSVRGARMRGGKTMDDAVQAFRGNEAVEWGSPRKIEGV